MMQLKIVFSILLLVFLLAACAKPCGSDDDAKLPGYVIYLDKVCCNFSNLITIVVMAVILNLVDHSNPHPPRCHPPLRRTMREMKRRMMRKKIVQRSVLLRACHCPLNLRSRLDFVYI